MKNNNVSIYSTPTCVYCEMAKDFLKENGIEYAEYDVAIDLEKRKEMISKSNQMGVPVITIGDNVLVGYNELKLRELLGIE